MSLSIEDVLIYLVKNQKYDQLQSALDQLKSIQDLKNVIAEKQQQITQHREQILNLISKDDLSAIKDGTVSANEYIVERRLSGINLLRTGQPPIYVGEVELRKYHLISDLDEIQDRDLVSVDGTTIKLIKHQPHDDQIGVFHQIIVEEDPMLGLIAKKHVDGSTIKQDDLPLVVKLNPKAKIKPSDVIDYAYYLGTDMAAGTVRWHYQTDQPLVPKQVKTKKTKEKSTDDTVNSVKEHVQLDLKDQKILLISDHVNVDQVADTLLKHYQAANVDIYGSQNSNHQATSLSALMAAIEQHDIVIICTDFLHHAVSQAAILNLKQHPEINYAVSAKSSLTFIERALYRAIHHLPAYEATGQMQEYPKEIAMNSNEKA